MWKAQFFNPAIISPSTVLVLGSSLNSKLLLTFLFPLSLLWFLIQSISLPNMSQSVGKHVCVTFLHAFEIFLSPFVFSLLQLVPGGEYPVFLLYMHGPCCLWPAFVVPVATTAQISVFLNLFGKPGDRKCNQLREQEDCVPVCCILLATLSISMSTSLFVTAVILILSCS